MKTQKFRETFFANSYGDQVESFKQTKMIENLVMMTPLIGALRDKKLAQ